MIIAACDRSIAAPIDIVWSLVSTADGFNRWLSVQATIDLRPGGVIRWVHDNGWVVAGEVIEVVPMRRLTFSYGWEHGGYDVPVGSSVVTLELAAIPGGTRISVRHRGLTDEQAERHGAGWAMFIEQLALRVDDHEEHR